MIYVRGGNDSGHLQAYIRILLLLTMEKEFDLHTAVRATRNEFSGNQLLEKDVMKDPFEQFAVWLDAAFRAGNRLANAMVLSTVDASGWPSSRMMLLRDFSRKGFTFFTNYESNKASDLVGNPKASLLFFWGDFGRQVRIAGEVQKLPEKESDSYFASRPFESRVGAWASAQSRVVSDRTELDERYRQLLKQYQESQVPRPAYWGGYVLRPEKFEFWQGRANRLHDRILYQKDPKKGWFIVRLMP